MTPNADYGALEPYRIDAEVFAINCARFGLPVEYWAPALAVIEEWINRGQPPGRSPRDGSRPSNRCGEGQPQPGRLSLTTGAGA